LKHSQQWGGTKVRNERRKRRSSKRNCGIGEGKDQNGRKKKKGGFAGRNLNTTEEGGKAETGVVGKGGSLEVKVKSHPRTEEEKNLKNGRGGLRFGR